jgi:hypothetical protein
MRSKHVGAFLAIGFALVCGLMSRAAVAADKVPAEKLLPENVLAFVTIPDMQEAHKSWEHSLLGQLGEDPEFQEFWKDVEGQIDELSQRFETETGVGLKQLCDIPAGEFAAAFLHTRGAGGSLVALLDVDEDHDSLDKLLAKAEAALTKQGATKTAEDHSGTEIIVYNIPRPKPADEADEDADGEDKDVSDDADKEEAAADDTTDETEEEDVAVDAQDADEADDALKPRTLAYFL